MPMKISKADEKVFNELADIAATACSNLREFISDYIIDPRVEEMADWSEKRLESDKGETARSWLNEWEEFRDAIPEFDTFPSMDPEA